MIETLRPNAAGDDTQLYLQNPPSGGFNWDRMDEVVADDYTTCLTSKWSHIRWVHDLYNLPAHSVLGTITKITVYSRGWTDSPESDSPPSQRNVIKTHGEVRYGTPEDQTTTWTTHSTIWATNPITESPWTWAEIDALQIGIDLHCGYGAGDPGWAFVTQVYVEVNYADAPTVNTNPASNIEEETATLNGEITAVFGQNADERGFDWGLNTSYGNSWTESNSYGIAAFSHGASGLSPGTTIHFRAKAHNSAGWGYGDDLTFITKPEACTNMVATAISDSQIDVSWTKGDGAVNTVVRRAVGAYPATIADGDEAYNGPSASFSDQELDPSTAYYYRSWCYTDPHYADAYCQDNATTQAVPVFPAPPTVTTESANDIEQTLATINGVLTNDGGEACDCWFEWSKAGGTIYTTAVQSGKTTGALFLASLTDLTHNTRYHFRAIAENSTGITYGANMYFVTESPALLEYSLLQPELAAELLT